MCWWRLIPVKSLKGKRECSAILEGLLVLGVSSSWPPKWPKSRECWNSYGIGRVGISTFRIGDEQVAWWSFWLHDQGVHQWRTQTGWIVTVRSYRVGGILFYSLLLYLHLVVKGTGDTGSHIFVHNSYINDGVCLVFPNMVDLNISPESCRMIWSWVDSDIVWLYCTWLFRPWYIPTWVDNGFVLDGLLG